jgi:hypothetical protein
MGVVDDAYKTATSGLDFENRLSRLRGAFVRRRGTFLNAQHSDWNAEKLSSQIKAELGAVDSYLKTKDSIIDGTETVSPRHLDLKVQANYHASSDANMRSALEQLYRSFRHHWIQDIVWRAVAIHNELWKSPHTPPKLETVALDELVDRRLRAVEQMTSNVNAVWTLGVGLSPFTRTWIISGPTGPWKDGFLVRNFEYPELPKDQFKDFLPQMTEWKEVGGRIVFSPPASQAPIRFPKEIRSAWAVSGGRTPWVIYQPREGRKLADVIHRMFDPPREDFLERNLLYCDMVASAIAIEALWLGLRRRDGDDDAFEAIPDGKTNYVRLGPVVRFDRRHDIDVLMADDGDPYFENLEIEFDDLQVGDFVCFWSSRLYDLLFSVGAWGNEFSYVMDVDLDQNGKVRILANGPQIKVAGHGLGTMLYNEMAASLIDWIKLALLPAYFPIDSGVTGAATNFKIHTGAVVELWHPYEAFDRPGAWWIRIPKSMWHDEWDFATVADALKAMPRTIAHDMASGGTGYTGPVEIDALYFPLYEPTVARSAVDRDSWSAYLRQRKADPTFRARSSTLNRITVDGQLAPGLYYRGAQTKIPVVRPRPRT